MTKKYRHIRLCFTRRPITLRNHILQKLCIFLTGGAYAPYATCMATPLACVYRVSSEQRQRWSRRRLRYLRVGRRRRRRNPSRSVDTTWKVPGRRWVPLCAHRLKTRSDDCYNCSPPIVDSCFAAPLLTKHSL